MTKICGKTHIVDEVAKKLDIKKATIEQIYDAILDTAKQALSDGYKISLQEIGSLKTVDREERKSRNPQTGELITTPKHKAVKFTTSDILKKFINAT